MLMIVRTIYMTAWLSARLIYIVRHKYEENIAPRTVFWK